MVRFEQALNSSSVGACMGLLFHVWKVAKGRLHVYLQWIPVC